MKLLIPSLAALFVAATLSPAAAANRFAVVCIKNRTQIPVNYQIKWADVGRWESQVLHPGRQTSFAHQYDSQDENRSPRLNIRFDSNLSKSNFSTGYKLERYRAAGDSCAEGKPYAFEYEPSNRNFIDLKAL
jgi:hypothetical protein